MRDTTNPEREQLRETIATAVAEFEKRGGKPQKEARIMAQKNTTPAGIVPLEQETRASLPTGEAAYHLNRKMQTLHIWACKGNGPLKPIRINGRLAWLVADIKRVLSGEVAK